MKINKIILAEDDPSTRLVIARGVESTGKYTVIESSNGARAWDVLNDNSGIKMLITDMQMPDMDGNELIAKIRSSKKFSKIPILVVSGVVGPNDIHKILEEGATRFLPKPINLKHLMEYVEALLSES
ncbi:MAG: response regulator [Proteobacteria bacterium]|nr:response regulator [Pseudomonadota bacterium]